MGLPVDCRSTAGRCWLVLAGGAAVSAEAGKPLERQLKGCRSIRPDGVTNRIVYRLLEEGDLVEIIAIGRRRDDEVYSVASGRLR